MIKVGSRVRHPEHGVGTLLGYKESIAYAAVEFDHMSVGHDCTLSEYNAIRPARDNKGWYVPIAKLTPIRQPKKRKAEKRVKSKSAKFKE